MQPAMSASRAFHVAAAVSVALGLLGGGVLVVVNPLWAVCAAIALVVLVWTVVQRPQPSLILLALPLSLVAPPLLVIGIASKSMRVTLPDVVILVALLAWAGRPIKVKGAWVAGNVLLVAWTTVTVFVSQDLGRSLFGLKVVAEVAAVALIAATATTISPRVMFRRLAWSAGAMSVAITLQLASQGALDLLALGRNDSSLATDVAMLHNSATTLSVEVGRSNYAGAIILLGIIALTCYWSYIESTWERVAVVAVAAIGVLGMVGTGSKSQLISLGIVLLLAAAAALKAPKRRQRISNLIAASAIGVMTLASVAGLWTYLVAVFAPLSRTGTSQYGTVGQRFEIWEAALNTIREHLLFGVGVADLHLQAGIGLLSDFPTAHNTVLNVAAETGFPGLVIYLWLLCVPIIWSRKRLRPVSVLLVSGLFVAGLAEPTLRTGPYDFVAWLFVGSIVALASAGPTADLGAAPTRAEAIKKEEEAVTLAARRIR